MKHVIFILTWVFSISAYSQIDGSSGNRTSNLEFGYTFFRSEPDLSSHFTPLITVGIAGNAGTESSWGNSWDAHGALHFYLPQKITSTFDSTSYTAWGWELMTSFHGYDLFRRNRKFDAVVGPGFFFGQLFLKSESYNDNQAKKYINPFVAPMARLDIRVIINRVSLGTRISYRYDVTKDNWKRQNSNVPEIPGYRFREVQMLLYVGYNFNNIGK